MLKREFESVFDVPVKGVDGTENFLNQFRGKILMFVNTTGKCGNSNQWPLVEEIISQYRDKDVEVIYTPTNDYCGSVTFDGYEYGITHGKVSADYALKTYGITSPFTDLVSSRNRVWPVKNTLYDDDIQDWVKDEIALPDLSMEQKPRDALYCFLTPRPDIEILDGNFHKIITNRKGQPVAIFANGTLAEAAYDKWKNKLFTDETYEWSHLEGEPFVGPIEQEVENLKAVIEEIMATDNCSDIRFKYDPYNEIYPEWIHYDNIVQHAEVHAAALRHITEQNK